MTVIDLATRRAERCHCDLRFGAAHMAYCPVWRRQCREAGHAPSVLERLQNGRVFCGSCTTIPVDEEATLKRHVIGDAR